MSKSLLIFSYGQSNADCHDAGPSFTAKCLRDPRIVVPNDGYGFRGLVGRPRKKPITGFEPAFDNAPLVQSIGHAAAARYLLENPKTAYSKIIVRSGAKGGRPLCGFKNGDRDIYGIYLDSAGDLSPLLMDMFEDIRQIAAAAKAEGAPIDHVVIPFFHGEADRSATRSGYTAVLSDMMNVIEKRLAKLDLPVTWLMTQPSGTSASHAGNAWANRMSVLDICDARANVHFASANYAYELCDAAHLNATSKALIGEKLGLQMSNVLHGVPLAPTKLLHARMDGTTIDLTFDGPYGVKLVQRELPNPHTPYGFEIDGRSDQLIKRVRQIGTHQVQLHCALPVCASQGELRYAFSRNVRGQSDDETLYPFGRGGLCENWETKSSVIPRRRVRRWVPGFALPLSEFAQNELAA